MYKYLSQSKILVIDDFAGFRQTIKTMLTSLGAQHIDQASNGSEALKSCSGVKYNIIFCDYNLGDGQDGQQILEELHQRSLMRRGTLFLMVTAETTTAQVMGAIEYRPDAYLTKPFTNEQLGQRLKRLIAKNVALTKIYLAINKGEINQALELCDSVITETPKVKYSALRIKSELLEQQKKYVKAQELYEAVSKEQPVLWAMVGLGRLLFIQGDVPAALSHFLDMRENFPRQVSLLDWIAKCHNALGEGQKAEETLKEAISISPKSVSRQASLGEIAESLNNFELAQKAYARTIQEGTYSCMLKPRHFERYYDNTREVVATMSPLDKSRILAETQMVQKKMERTYSNDPTARATGLSSAAMLYSSVGQSDISSGILSKLTKTLEDPDCKISQQQMKTIKNNMQTLADDKSVEKHLDKISSRLIVIKEEIKTQQELSKKTAETLPVSSPAEPLDDSIIAKNLNTEGMSLAKQSKPLEALEKFRESMKVYAQNLNAVLNAAQLIIEHDSLKTDPERIKEAEQLLFEVDIEETDIRWKRYQNLLKRVSNV